MPEGDTLSVHFSGDEEQQDLKEWMERQWEEGDFANRSHVVRVALKRLRKESTSEVLF